MFCFLGYPPDAKHKTDLDPDKLKDTKIDLAFVLSCRIRTGRSIRGFTLPPFCTRAERRKVEAIVTIALSSLVGEYSGDHFIFSLSCTLVLVYFHILSECYV